MNTLAQLTATALLGTERRSTEWPVLDNVAGALLAKLPKDNVEKALLQTMGVLGTCELAGILPKKNDDAPSGSVADSLRHEADPALFQALRGVLEDGPLRLQVEALRSLARAGLGLPHRLLPKALDGGRRSTALRPALMAVIGARGSWLAEQNGVWAYASGVASAAPDDEVWANGSLDQRKIFLSSLRSSEADKARELVVEALKSEGARERAAFIECLAPGLSVKDEDLLVATLSDKSKEARSAALRLLSSLPASRFMQRMAARIDPCIQIDKKFLRGTVASIEPPLAFVAEWRDDLIEEAKPKAASIGERGWWLLQFVRATPLAWWEERLGMTPTELIAWAQTSEWKDVLLQGWATAQTCQRRTEWAEAFLDTKSVMKQPDVLELLDSLPLPLREKHFLILWPPPAANGQVSASQLLDRLMSRISFDEPALSLNVARRILNQLKDLVNTGSARHDWQLRASLAEFACLVPAAIFDECATGWEITKEEARPFAEAVSKLSIILDQRKILNRL